MAATLIALMHAGGCLSPRHDILRLTSRAGAIAAGAAAARKQRDEAVAHEFRLRVPP